jgi:triosephosphate isomerase
MRRKIIAGNWKMNLTRTEGVELLRELADSAKLRADVEILVCPPFTALESIGSVARELGVGLGAQDVFWKERGAYTRQISAAMLLDLGVTHVIVGHSEARGRFGVAEPDFDAEILRHFGDTDASVNRKLRAAQGAGLTPICCVGETIAERRAGETDRVLELQVLRALEGVSCDGASLVLAYEPVWAIGTGEGCDADEADRVCGLIRRLASSALGGGASSEPRVQYGGSVKPDNAPELLSKPNIDGALVGGASLNAADFAAIIEACPR